MWFVPESALLVSALTSPQVQTNPVHELKESIYGIIQALELSQNSQAQKETLAPRFERLENSLGAFEFKLRAFTGASGSIRHWIGSYTEGTTKLTALFEENSEGKGYNGFDLRLKKLRFNFSEGDNRQRMNITLYGEKGAYVGYSSQNTDMHQEAIYGGLSLGKGFAIDVGAVSSGDKRIRVLRDSENEQVSTTVGKDASGNTIGSISLNNNKIWFNAQGGENMPTNYRLTFGDIDRTRSKQAFAFIDGGLNEAFPNAATYKISLGDSPTFHLIRRIPGQFLGIHPGDTGLDILYTTNTSIDVSAGVRLNNSGDLKSPFIGARYQRDLKLGTNKFGFEVGSSIQKNTELRARIEYSDKTRQTSFGLLVMTKLK